MITTVKKPTNACKGLWTGIIAIGAVALIIAITTIGSQINTFIAGVQNTFFLYRNGYIVLPLGRLGIGTAMPLWALSIQSTDNSQPQVVFLPVSGSPNANPFGVWWDGTNLKLVVQNSTGGWQPQVVVGQSGNMGFGNVSVISDRITLGPNLAYPTAATYGLNAYNLFGGISMVDGNGNTRVALTPSTYSGTNTTVLLLRTQQANGTLGVSASLWPDGSLVLGSSSPPQAKLTVYGDALAQVGTWWPSDRRLKTEIQPMACEDALRMKQQLSAVLYTRDGVQNAGFIAQDVQRVIPTAAKELPNGMLAIDPMQIMAVGWQAAKCSTELRDTVPSGLRERERERVAEGVRGTQ